MTRRMKKRIRKKIDKHVKAWLSQHQSYIHQTPRYSIPIRTYHDTPKILRAAIDFNRTQMELNLFPRKETEKWIRKKLMRAFVDSEDFEDCVKVEEFELPGTYPGKVRFTATLRVLPPEEDWKDAWKS